MAHHAEAVFQAAADRAYTLHLTPLVVGEAVFVLTSFYKLSVGEAVAALQGVIDLPGVRAEQSTVLLRALGLYVQTPKLHFVDAYLIARSEAEGRGVASFDKRIEKTGLVPVCNPMDMAE